MTRNALVPPMPITASEYYSTARTLVGGPRTHVRQAALAARTRAETTAATTLSPYWDWESGDPIPPTSGAAFLYGPAAVRLYNAIYDTEVWFTYERREDDTLVGVLPVRNGGIATGDIP